MLANSAVQTRINLEIQPFLWNVNRRQKAIDSINFNSIVVDVAHVPIHNAIFTQLIFNETNTDSEFGCAF